MKAMRAYPKIETSFWAKPVPSKKYDWEAVTVDYEPGHPIGWGATEEEAIADLKMELDSRDE